MNKPSGYVCSAVSDSHKTVYSLLPLELQNLVQNAKRGQRLHTVGRLDCDTSGLLLLTTDGDFSHKLTCPENKVQKSYIAELKNAGDISYIQKAKNGLTLPPEKKAPEQQTSSVELKPLNAELSKWQITITEGKFHEVRRIFKALGNKVIFLKRIKMGDYELPEELKEGEYIVIPDYVVNLIFN